MKKALILGEAFYPEDFLINDLVKEWEKKGYRFEVLTRVPSYPHGHIYKGYKNKIYQTTYYNSIKIHRIPIIPGYERSVLIKLLNYFSFVFWSCWVILFIGKRFDKVFIYHTGPLTLAISGILLKKIYKAHVTIWTQDLWPDTVYAYGFKRSKLLSYCLDKFVKWIYTNCDSILVSCNGFIDRLYPYTLHKKIEFIPNWSLIEYNPSRKVTLPGKFNFTFAGNVGKVQNLENIVKGFEIFSNNHQDIYLNILGDGSFLSDLKKIVSDRYIKNINFTGRIPLREMSDYYAASDVLILSLKDVPIYENMIPSKFQTYLCTFKPIYAIFNGEVRRLVENYNIGIGASPGNITDIAKGFNYFLCLSTEELEVISKNSKMLLDSVFNRNKIIHKINSIFWTA